MAAMTNRLITIQMAMAPRLAVHNILIRFQGSDLVIPTTSFSDSVMRAVPVTVSGCARHPDAIQFLIQKDDTSSKHRNRIHGGAGPIRNRQWCDCQHELPALARRRGLAERLQIGAIKYVDAKDLQNEVVKGSPGQIARRLRQVARRFPNQQSDVALLEPRDHGVIEPCGLVAGLWPQLRPARPFPPT